jgi:hypothetical protein
MSIEARWFWVGFFLGNANSAIILFLLALGVI